MTGITSTGWKKKDQSVPHTFYPRLSEIFSRLDRDDKGYLTEDDLSRCLDFGYSFR